MKKGQAETVVTADRSMDRKQYEKALRALQIELCSLQDWVKEQGARVVVVFDGRDAAFKNWRNCTAPANRRGGTRKLAWIRHGPR